MKRGNLPTGQKTTITGRKKDLHQICSWQMNIILKCANWGVNQGRKDGKCHNLPPNLKPRVNWYAKGAFTIFADQFAQIWYDTAMNNFFRPGNIYHLLTESEVITGKSPTEASLSLDDSTSRPGPEISQQLPNGRCYRLSYYMAFYRK